mmetsp:Transcript_26164/g.42833  ORF Transcript_26164/g.42833 Transcript_26164/m.42833 type:complete len:214 (-) Transcript_26164:238-879(-)
MVVRLSLSARSNAVSGPEAVNATSLSSMSASLVLAKETPMTPPASGFSLSGPPGLLQLCKARIKSPGATSWVPRARFTRQNTSCAGRMPSPLRLPRAAWQTRATSASTSAREVPPLATGRPCASRRPKSAKRSSMSVCLLGSSEEAITAAIDRMDATTCSARSFKALKSVRAKSSSSRAPFAVASCLAKSFCRPPRAGASYDPFCHPAALTAS